MSESKTLLVVEDNDFVRMQIVKYLHEEGYETIEATDGNKAMENMSQDIDMAIVDIRMEPVGGFEFLRNIRIHEYQTPVVLVTGDNDPELLNEASKHGVAAVLMKPVQRDRLVKVVSRMLQHKARTHR